ncbi:MAG: flagellar basal-body MS-ring/collar protein FliF [Candidatus Sericytochromatia bacterium]|nr:flagellar basal-body MS-ring/collar protein FliF [Candidatus Sericytochromatia bacterium]
MNSFLQQLAEDAGRLWGQMSAVQRMLLIGVTLGVIALFGILVLWAQQPAYVTLYTRLSDKDAGAIVGKLKERSIPYELSGNSIGVPSGQVHDIRLALASEGLPSGGTVGFQDLFNGNANWTATDFERNLNYQRGLEGELSRTIEALEGVDKARVHIVIPKESLFVSEEQPPTASVMLSMNSANVLEGSQVRTIQHLVAKAVPRLKKENVFVTDTTGKDYTEAAGGLEVSGTDLSARQLELKRKYERDLERRLQAMLDDVLGAEKSVVRVSTMWDFAQLETNSESFAPSIPGGTGGLLVSERGKTEQYNGQAAGDGGVAGSTENVQPNSYPAGGQNQTGLYNNNEYTRNYNTNKEVQRRIKEPAVLRDTIVSVAYDVTPPSPPPGAGRGRGRNAAAAAATEPPPDLTPMIKQLVGAAAGIPDPLNSTKVVVNPMLFKGVDAKARQEQARQDALWARGIRIGTLVASVLIALIIFGMFLTAFRRRQAVMDELGTTVPSGGMSADELSLALLEANGARIGKPPSPEDAKLLGMQKELAQYIKQNPREAVTLVRAWVNSDE